MAISLVGLMAGCVSKSTHEQTVQDLAATNKTLRQVEQQLADRSQELDKLKTELARVTARLDAFQDLDKQLFAHVAGITAPTERLKGLQQYVALFPSSDQATTAQEMIKQLEAKPVAATKSKTAVLTPVKPSLEDAELQRKIRAGESLDLAQLSVALTGLTHHDLAKLLGGATRFERMAGGVDVWVYQAIKVSGDENTSGPLRVFLQNGKVTGVEMGAR